MCENRKGDAALDENEFDVDRARRETPGCEHVLHFNNAGASLMPVPVLETMVEYLRREAAAGGYETAERSAGALEGVYDALAELLACRREEIAFIENATRAWDMAFYSIPFKPGDRILTSVSEYASNYIAFLQTSRRTGAVVEPVPNDASGRVCLESLERMIDDRVKLVAVTHVPTNGGLVQPVGEIGKIARSAGVLFLLDACQSVGQIPLDVEALGCDILSGTGRKYLRGPRGTGFLFIRRSLLESLEPVFLDLHAATWTAKDRYEIRPDARRFENWETNFAGKAGLAAAVRYALSWGMENIRERVAGLAESLRGTLAGLPGVSVHDLGIKKCGIVSFTIEGREPEEIKRLLGEQRMNVSVSGVESTRLDMERRGLGSVVRASVHYYNTAGEIERFSAAVSRLASA
ncbi:MAG: aminotransferase class V-fold PLP-dependent enzyme, partial [Candidatus Aminicenantes bacterium]|nr:aminotransferase class V-fold PLP-dependent enzyme [Candidatus Aminicenantes bacterium]